MRRLASKKSRPPDLQAKRARFYAFGLWHFPAENEGTGLRSKTSSRNRAKKTTQRELERARGTSRDARQLSFWPPIVASFAPGDARGPEELTAPGLAPASGARVRAIRRGEDSRGTR